MGTHLLEKPYVFQELAGLDLPTLIEASAGTGKTYTLEHLVFDHLVTRRIPIGELLVVTFTDRATNELKVRIRNFLHDVVIGKLDVQQMDLGQQYWELDDEDLKFIEEQLYHFNQASIMTMHSFCNRILSEQAFYLDTLFEQEHQDSQTLFNQALNKALFTSLTSNAELADYAHSWFKNHSKESLAELISQTFPPLDTIAPIFDEKNLNRYIQFLSRNTSKKKIQDFFNWFDTNFRFIPPDEMSIYSEIITILSQHASNKLSLPVLLEALEREHIRDLDFHNFSKLEMPPNPNIFNKDMFLLLQNISKKVVPLKVAVLQKFYVHVEQALEKIKAEGKFDFDDLIINLYNHLKNNPNSLLLKLLRRTYKVAFIDEFQDTDNMQWGIFKTIFLNPPQNNLYLIGDPKQGIYTFRRADIRVYQNAVREIEKIGNVVRLTQNFRSSPLMIEGINFLLNQKDPDPIFYGSIQYNNPVTCANNHMLLVNERDEAVPPITVYNITKKNKRERNFKEPFNTYYKSIIADEIFDILYQNNLYVLDKKMKNGEIVEVKRKITAKDIFVLVDTNSEAEQIAEALTVRRIPYSFSRKEGLFQTEEAKSILQLLQAIEKPDDSASKLAAWLTPFFDIAIDDFAVALQSPENEPHHSLLYHWKEEGDRGDFRALFSSIIRESGIYQRSIFFGNNHRRMTNINHIFEILLKETAANQLNFSDLIERLRSFVEKQALPKHSDRNSERSEPVTESVQIMTIHKAKGLQADIVFLFGGLFARFKNDWTYFFHYEHNNEVKRYLYIGIPYKPVARFNIICEKYEENQRLIYVAITRARVKLYLPYQNPDAFNMPNGEKIQEDLERASAILTNPKDFKQYTSNEQRRWSSQVAAMSLPATYTPLFLKLRGIVGRKDLSPKIFKIQIVTPSTDSFAMAANFEKSKLPDVAHWQLPELYYDQTTAYTKSLSNDSPFLTSYSKIKQNLKDLEVFETNESVETKTVITPKRALTLNENELPPGPLSGVFIHELLEKIPFQSFAADGDAFKHCTISEWKNNSDINHLVTSTATAHGIDPLYLPHVFHLLYKTLTTPVQLRDRKFPLWHLQQIVREAEFYFPVSCDAEKALFINTLNTRFRHEDGFVKGFIDMLFEAAGSYYFLDWKTDLIDNYDPESLARHVDEHYRTQAILYSMAVVKMLGITNQDDYNARFGGYLYIFCRGIGHDDFGYYFGREPYDQLTFSAAQLR